MIDALLFVPPTLLCDPHFNRSNLTGLVLVNCGDADEVPSSVNDERVVNLGQCVGMVFGWGAQLMASP